MKYLRSFTSKNAIKHERRFVLAVLMLLWIGLLAFPTLPIAVASEASAESTSSPELVETQTVSHGAASTRSPAAPFTMIIMNDPQIFWHWDEEEKAKAENQHKVDFIIDIVKTYQDHKWPTASQVAGNTAFDQSKVDSPFHEVKGVIINGDLTVNKDLNDEYRDYYVDQLYEACPNLPVYAGFGNHDSKWTVFVDLGHALLLDQDYPKDPYKRRLWTNFPNDVSSVHWDWENKKGSLSYSWNIGNYHFVQLNCFDLEKGETTDMWPYWFAGGGGTEPGIVTKTSPREWLEADLAEATDLGYKIVVNLHAWYGSNWDDLADNYFAKANVVAVFIGHQPTTGLQNDAGWGGHACDWDAKNAFGQPIPLIQGGHAGNFWDTPDDPRIHWKYDHQLLVVECADDYMNVGLAKCGDWGGSGYTGWVDPSSSRCLRTITWVNTPPSVTSLDPVVQRIYEGDFKRVASASFTDDPCFWDSWRIGVDYGDGSPPLEGPFGEGWGSLQAFPLNYMQHKYLDNGTYDFWVAVMDSSLVDDSDTCKLTVYNREPTVKTLDFSSQIVFEGAPVTVTATFSDPGVLDTHTANVTWGDGTSDDGNVVEDNGSGEVTSTHEYNAPGRYTVNVTVTDNDGGAGYKVAEIDVIVALSGFVMDEYHNKPVAGVTITCGGETTTTDAGGYYEFTPLDPGDYSVEMTIPLGSNSIVPNKPATIIAGQETIVNFTAYPLPDIIVTKATVDTERLAGDTITYHITVDNQGDGPATNIVITDVLPSMTTFISADHPATTNGQTLTWSIDTLNEHTSTTIELTVRVSLLVYPDTTLNNLVTVVFDDWYELPQTPESAAATIVILPTVPTGNVQGVGYWRRQIKAVQANKPCDYAESELLLLLEKIRVSSQVFETVSTLENAADLLATPTGKDTMETRATQQLFALWLNLAARAVAADTPLDLADVTTASTIAEALTQCEAILLDPTPTKASCECSKQICDLLNNGEGFSW